MAAIIGNRHFDEFEELGYTLLEGIVPQHFLLEFENRLADLVSAQLAALNLQPVHADPFIDLFSVGGPYGARFYTLLERLHVLNRISVHIGDALEAAGYFDRMGMKAPLVWPDIRADIPGDGVRQLPIHQDYKSTQCHKAHRLWVPLRPSNAEYGTMCAYPTSHRHGPVDHDLCDPLKPTVDPILYGDLDPVMFDLPAGDGVLMDPHLFHGSVPNRSSRTKFTLLIQIQDLATMIDPADRTYAEFTKLVAAREAREAAPE